MTTPFAWERPPSYWPDIALDYEPQGEPCGTCGKHTESGRRYWCGTCLALTCENCQDVGPCLPCQRQREDERDYAEVDGQFGLGLDFPCYWPTCDREGTHRHRVTMKGTQ